MLLSPALLWIGHYIRDPGLEHFYRDVLNFVQIAAPTLALFWVAALLRLFWPDRLPGSLPRSSTHMRFFVRLGRGLFWVAGWCFAGVMLMCILGRTKGTLGNLLAFNSCTVLGLGFAVQEYVKFRSEPGTRVEPLIEPSMLVTGVPVIVLLGMMLIVSWDQPVWDILLGALFLAALWAYVKLVKKTLARRRELRGEMQTGASSPMA